MNHRSDSATSSKELLNQLHALVTEAETMIADSLGSQSTAAFEGLRARFNAAQQQLSDTCATARRQVATGVRKTDETIRANPYPSIAVAAGLGVLVGVLLGRRMT